MRLKKFFGQNFLINKSVSSFIVKNANITNSDCVVEIGPGLGSLTIPIAKNAKNVLAIEKDVEIAKILSKKLNNIGVKNVSLIIEDILKTDFAFYYKKINKNFVVLGNIPYNISSKIIMKIIQNRKYIDRAIIMLQKEVADRICSIPNSKKYGRISIFSQYYSKITKICDVSSNNFSPKPKVKSSLVKFCFSNKKKKHKHFVKNETLFFLIIKEAFSKRRKTLKNSLINSCLNFDRKICKLVFYKIGIDFNTRPESLSIEDFIKLTNYFSSYIIDK